MKRTKFLPVVMVTLLLAVLFSAFMPTAVQAKAKGPTIVEVALSVNAESGEFSTLIAALQSAELVGALNGKGQFTVFAPTDAAFAKLGLNAGNIGTLDKATLRNILLYHVARGARYAEDVVDASRIRMLNRGFTFVTVSGSTVSINDAQILAVDIKASNGVIHVIDTVLLP